MRKVARSFPLASVYISMISVLKNLFSFKKVYQDNCRFVYVWLILTHKQFIQTASVTGNPYAGNKGRLIINYKRSAEQDLVYLTAILKIAILFAEHNAGTF